MRLLYALQKEDKRYPAKKTLTFCKSPDMLNGHAVGKAF